MAKRKNVFAILLVACVILITFSHLSLKKGINAFNLQDNSKCFKNYSAFWDLTVLSNFSFLPDTCQFGNTNKTQLKQNFQQIFQDQHFKGIKCKPKAPKLFKTPRMMTALASYPGSGNTWTRHLIEQLTGISTTSAYCDRVLARTFKQECAKTKSLAICIKTHYTALLVYQARPRYSYDQAIIIIRNPYDAILSRYNFIHKGHTDTVDDLDAFSKDGWKHHIERESNTWINFHRYWLEGFKNKTHILWYDRLKDGHFFEELYDLSQFLGVIVTYRDLWCTWRNSEGQYHRTKKIKESENLKLYPEDIRIRIHNFTKEIDTIALKRFGDHMKFESKCDCSDNKTTLN